MVEPALLKAMCAQRVPAVCPFCELEGFTWDEFKVHAIDIHYFDGATHTLDPKVIDEQIMVFCTRCEEEIRAEDVRRRLK